MKSLLVVMTLLCLLASTNTNAQSIAHVDSDAVLTNMPEYKRAQSELESYSKQLERSLKNKEEELKQFYDKTVAEARNLTPIELEEREKQFQKMQADLQKAVGEADGKLFKKQQALTKPLYDKFNEALRKVAQANNYAYIIDKKLVLHAGGVDATEKVKRALGVQ